MNILRKCLFWAHLAAGITCGAIVGLLCFTGTTLAFEKELLAWAERDVRRVTIPSSSALPLGIDALAERMRLSFPEAKPTTIVVSRDPQTAVSFIVGRTESYHANPYTGDVFRSPSQGMGKFLQKMFELHRYLGFSGEVSRPRGKLVTGVANLSFCFLAISGLVLWCPRSLSWHAFRPSIWFMQNAVGRARDWNWHNVIGFWCAPALIILTLTALPISFQWAAKLTYSLTGTELPASGPQSSGAPPEPAMVKPPASPANPVTRQSMLAAVQAALPRWQTITLRFAHRPDAPKPQAVSYVVRETGTWPRTATTTLQFDPFSGALLKRDGYADLSAARKLRAWTRYLHTGEALGAWAQGLAAMASAGGIVLMATGFALSARRFLGRKSGTRYNS